MKPIKTLIFALIAMAVVACATSPEGKWAQGRTALTDVTNILSDARRPCVDVGPDDPGCLINDETALKIDKLVRAARYTLARLDGVAAGTELLSAETLMRELDRLLEQLLIEAATVQ